MGHRGSNCTPNRARRWSSETPRRPGFWPVNAAGIQVTTVVRSWPVNKVYDSVGNYMIVSYSEDSVGEVRPDRIDYTGHTSNPTTGTYNSVVFTYAPRTDQWPVYQAGMVQQTPDLLALVTTNAGSNVVYQYKLDYRPGTATQHSRVTAVTLCAGPAQCNTPCNGAANCLATTQFTWQGGTPRCRFGPQPTTQQHWARQVDRFRKWHVLHPERCVHFGFQRGRKSTTSLRLYRTTDRFVRRATPST